MLNYQPRHGTLDRPELWDGRAAERIVKVLFDRLSDVIAERMPYRSLEEFERAMRGDEYGLVGY